MPEALAEAAARVEEEWDELRPYLLGGAFGAVQAAAPLGAFMPSPADERLDALLGGTWDPADRRMFELGRGAAQTLVGIGQFVGGAKLTTSGLVLMGGGVVTSPTGVGAVVGIGGGAAAVGVGVAVAAEASTDIYAGVRTTMAAMAMPRGRGGASQPRGGVYVLKNKRGKVVRIGRSKDLASRESQHAREFKRLSFTARYWSDNYRVRRGLEQMLYDRYHFKGDLNGIRPIHPLNPARRIYLRAAREYLEKHGLPPP